MNGIIGAYTSVRDARRDLLAWEEGHPTVMAGVQVAAIVIGARVDAPEDAPSEVTGFAPNRSDPGHAIDRILDGRSGRGVSDEAILEAIRNPSAITREPNGSFRLIGKNATVVVNRAGKIITLWANNSGGYRH